MSIRASAGKLGGGGKPRGKKLPTRTKGVNISGIGFALYLNGSRRRYRNRRDERGKQEALKAMLEQTMAGSLLTESTESATLPWAVRNRKPAGKKQEIGAYRLRSSGSNETSEEQKYMWRRLFRIVDRPQSPPIILDCESLGAEATEKISRRFWNDEVLCRERNLILTASAKSAWQELASRCRQQGEDRVVGDNWGILILEEPQKELPALLRTAAELGGWIVTTGQTLCDKTKRIRCSGAMASASNSLFGKRDNEIERRLGLLSSE